MNEKISEKYLYKSGYIQEIQVLCFTYPKLTIFDPEFQTFI